MAPDRADVNWSPTARSLGNAHRLALINYGPRNPKLVYHHHLTTLPGMELMCDTVPMSDRQALTALWHGWVGAAPVCCEAVAVVMGVQPPLQYTTGTTRHKVLTCGHMLCGRPVAC